MIDKRVADPTEAVAGIRDGDSVMVGGFGEAGSPIELIHALVDNGAAGLTLISNNAGNGQIGLAALIRNGQVAKIICSFPRSSHSTVFPRLYRARRIELELVPQGTLAERIRAGGAGIPAFYTPTAARTNLEAGKERRMINGKLCLLEHGLVADWALVKGHAADWHGNLLFNKTARNFSPLMAMAGKTAVAQVTSVVKPGVLDPETIITPGIFVDRVVEVPDAQHESELVAQGACYP
jgi:3-oxoadipate CoA-transferase alpha subunit